MRNPVILFFLLLCLGWWGWMDWTAADPDVVRQGGLNSELWLDGIYRAIQVFTLEFDVNAYAPPMPWQLRLTIFLAPLLSIWAIVRLFTSALMPVPLAISSILWGRTKYVIIGYGEVGRGLSRAIMDLHAQGATGSWISRKRARPRVVVVAADVEDQDFVEGARDRIEIYRGDVCQRGRLGKWVKRLLSAERVLVALGDDGQTLEVGRALLADPRLDPNKVWLHINDHELLERLRDMEPSEAVLLRGNARVFSLTEATIEQLFAEATPVRTAISMGHTRLHAVIVGETSALPAFVAGIALYGTFPQPGLERPRITLLTADPDKALGDLRARFPGIEEWIIIGAVEKDPNRIAWLDGDFQRSEIESIDPPSLYLVGYDGCEDGLEHALALRRSMSLGRCDYAPIHVMSRYTAGLEQQAVRSDVTIGRELHFIGGHRQSAQYSVALNPQVEQVARAFHENWKGENDPGYDQLSETLRNSNWRAALHSVQKLQALGFENVDARRPAFGLGRADVDWLQDAVENQADTLDGLAHAEHVRWCIDRVLDGWKVGPVASTRARIRPQLGYGRLKYVELSDGEKAKDAEQLTALIAHFRTLDAQRHVLADVPLQRVTCEPAFHLGWESDGGVRWIGDAPDAAEAVSACEGIVRLRIQVDPLHSVDADVQRRAQGALADCVEALLGAAPEGRLTCRLERPIWEDWGWVKEIEERGLDRIEAVTLCPLAIATVGSAKLSAEDKAKLTEMAGPERRLRSIASDSEATPLSLLERVRVVAVSGKTSGKKQDELLELARQMKRTVIS